MMRRFITVTAVFSALALWLTLSAGPRDSAAADGIRWLSLDSAKAAARQSKKPVFISFYTTWCGFCKKLERDTFKDPAVVKALNEYFLPVKLDGDEEEALAQAYGVRGYPTLVFTDATGKTLLSSPGYRPPGSFMDVLKYVHSGFYKKMSFDKFVGDGYPGRYNFSAGAR